MTTALDTLYPWQNWPGVQRYIDLNWDPPNTPHHSIIGLTGSGKSYLAVNGILPLCLKDRVLIIDNKGDDPVLSNVGKPITELPKKAWYSEIGRKRDEPMSNWYRLVVSDDYATGRKQVGTALGHVYHQGDWIVVVDETRAVTGRERPFLNLGSYLDRIWLKGRSRYVSLIALTQAPRFVPTSFYDQASFHWIGRIKDEQRQKRILEFSGMEKKSIGVIQDLQRRQWLLSADNGEYYARTTVTTKLRG